MLSVLIPSYDTNIIPLFEELHHQLMDSELDFEIICIDNASRSEKCIKNQKVNNMVNCRYLENQTDVGRSAIRNQLASEAKGDWLLFLDDDVMPTNSDFISTYKSAMNSNNEVVSGGLRYEDDSPQKGHLRYKYGIKHEQIDAKTRSQNPYKFFLASNLLILKKLFESIKFNEEIWQYGYEDLLFSKDLESKNISIQHIDNPVYHLGIDENEVFVEKSEHAIRNMHTLIKKGMLNAGDTNIYKVYQRFKSLGLLWFLRVFLTHFRNKAIQGSLFYFNLYRLSYLSRLLKNSQ
ncbi:MAG: glycosyltransferase family 2 protein [Polaribacter sp.]